MPDYQFSKLALIKQTTMKLEKNYRSSEKIIKYFDNFNVHGNAISPAANDKDYPSRIIYDQCISKDNLKDHLSDIINEYVSKHSISPNEICVIAPWWVHLSSITRTLMLKLPTYDFNGPGLVPFAKDPENFWYKLAKIVLTEPSPLIYFRRVQWAKEVLNHLERVGVTLNGLDSKSFLKASNDIIVKEIDGLTYLNNYFDALFERLNINYVNYNELQEHRKSFFSSSQARIKRIADEGLTAISSIDSFRKVFKSKDGITVSTIHGVKGDEFDVVIAFGLLQGMVPHFSDLNGNENAKKLLYVIGSRARKHLHLISERGRTDGRGMPYLATSALQKYSYLYDKNI